MYASYRIEVSPSLYGSEGGLTINNTLQLPNDKLSLHTFKTALMNSMEKLLPKVWEAYLLNQELKQTLDQRLSEEASLFASEPVEDFRDEDEGLFEETDSIAATESENEEWLKRYGRNF